MLRKILNGTSRSKKKKRKQCIGDSFINHFVIELEKYILDSGSIKLLISSVVEQTEEIDEGLVGFWYGIELFDSSTKQIITRLPIYNELDACFISEIAENRRKTRILLATNLAEYLKVYFENEPGISRVIKEIVVIEDIRVHDSLFDHKKIAITY